MKKLLLSLFIILLIPTLSYAALSGDMDWDVRTTGDDTNGGCYDATADGGTDYSQQDSPQLVITDGATSGIGVTTFTSAAAGFTSDMVDNCIQLASGTNVTAGFYQITAFGSTSSVTLDRAPDDGVGGVSSGVGDVGGALATITKAVDNIDDNHEIFVELGTYTEQFDASNDDVGTNGNLRSLIGFQTTHAGEATGSNRPTIDGESTRTYCGKLGSGWEIRNFICTGTTQSGWENDGGVRYVNIKTTYGSFQGMRSELWTAFDMEFTGSGGGTIGGGNCIGCYSHDNSNEGFGDAIGANDNVSCDSCVSDTNGGPGLVHGRHSTIRNSVFYNNTGSGIVNNATATKDLYCFYYNNITQDNSAYGIDRTSGDQQCRADYNIHYSNTSGLTNNVATGVNDVGNVDPKFNAPASGDFTITSGSPAENAGFIQSLSGLTGDYNWNIGVDQSKPSSGGGGAGTTSGGGAY